MRVCERDGQNEVIPESFENCPWGESAPKTVCLSEDDHDRLYSEEFIDNYNAALDQYAQQCAPLVTSMSAYIPALRGANVFFQGAKRAGFKAQVSAGLASAPAPYIPPLNKAGELVCKYALSPNSLLAHNAIEMTESNLGEIPVCTPNISNMLPISPEEYQKLKAGR